VIRNLNPPRKRPRAIWVFGREFQRVRFCVMLTLLFVGVALLSLGRIAMPLPFVGGLLIVMAVFQLAVMWTDD
jgi:hypothetical protein